MGPNDNCKTIQKLTLDSPCTNGRTHAIQLKVNTTNCICCQMKFLERFIKTNLPGTSPIANVCDNAILFWQTKIKPF